VLTGLPDAIGVVWPQAVVQLGVGSSTQPLPGDHLPALRAEQGLASRTGTAADSRLGPAASQ